MSHDVFISYSIKDLAAAETVCRELEAAGLRCWYASRDMLPGCDFARALVDAIDTCGSLVPVLSGNSNASRGQAREIERALSLEKLILPFRITRDDPTGSLAYLLSGLDWIDASSPPIEEHVPALAMRLRGSPPSENTPPRPDSLKQSPAPGEGAPNAVFVSYRRDDGAQVARLLRAELQARGYRTFLDVDDLKPGHFDEALLREIEIAPNFVLVLTPDSLTRCASEGDWVRREIAHALETGRNIIPILMPGFEFSIVPELPEDIRVLSLHPGDPLQS